MKRKRKKGEKDCGVPCYFLHHLPRQLLTRRGGEKGGSEVEKEEGEEENDEENPNERA